MLIDRSRDKFRLGPVILSGADVVSAAAIRNEYAGPGTKTWMMNIRLSPSGTAALADATAVAVQSDPPHNEIAVIVDGRVVSTPAVQSQINDGVAEITGLTRPEAGRLAGRI